MKDLLKPIKIETYQCPVCDTIYDTKEEAIKCLSQPGVIPSYSEGDVVYLPNRYPDNPKKPFLKRKITKVGGIVLEISWRHREHKIEYKLNEAVQLGKTCWVGESSASDDDQYRLARDDDFYPLGYNYPGGIVISPETIENWEEVL